jgi:hypothetical protein
MRLLRNGVCVMATTLLLATVEACIHKVPVEVPIDPNWTSPQVVRFVARPEIIRRGEQATITWNVRNVSRVTLEEALDPDGNPAEQWLHSLGDFPANGSLNVSPKTTATYVLSCGPPSESGPVCVSASVNIVVK